MRHNLQRLAALAALAGVFSAVNASSVRAEFQIQEADID